MDLGCTAGLLEDCTMETVGAPSIAYGSCKHCLLLLTAQKQNNT